MTRSSVQTTSPDANAEDAGHARTRSRSQGAVWLLAFVTYFGLISAWALATPISASPDEPEHVHKAAAVVRGEIIVDDPPTGMRPYVSAPEGMLSASKRDLCYAFQPTVTADCAQTPQGSAEQVEVRSGAARYNPAYYAVVGLPSLAWPNATGIYLMRLVSGALCAGLLASAMASAASWRRSRLLVTGLFVAVSPMVFFLSATVNPSPVEIVAAISLWTSGLVLAVTPLGNSLVPVLLRRCAVAASVLVVTRQLSPLWVAIIAMILLAVAGRHRVSELIARRDARLWALLVFVTTALSTAWTILAGSLGNGYPDVPERTLVDGIKGSILRIPYRTEQMIGIFGWLDTRAPWFTYVAYFACVGVIILLGLVASRRRGLMLVLLTLGVAVVVPVAIEGSQATRYGYIWQGRYTLPLAVGVPLVAMLVTGLRGQVPEDVTRRLGLWLAGLVGLAHAGAFAHALLRYQVGVGNGYDLLAGAWHPPGGSGLVLVIFGLALAANLALLATLSRSRTSRPRSGRRDPVSAIDDHVRDRSAGAPATADSGRLEGEPSSADNR